MKTLVKSLVILIIAVVGLNSNLQAQGKVYCYNGADWVQKYRNPSIPGIAGDTLKLGYKSNDSTFEKVIWKVEDPNTLVETTLDTSETTDIIFHSDILLTAFKAYDTTGQGLVLAEIYIMPKFVPSNLVIGIFTGNKSALEQLRLSDFNITVNSPGGGYKAYCDSIFWYRNDTLVHSGLDTIYNAELSGDYSIKAKLVYKTAYQGDTNTFARFQFSNTVTVENAVVTNAEYELTNVEFKIYPNPTSDYLNFSEEIEYEIYTINGMLTQKGKDNMVDVRNLDSGVYIVKTLHKTIRFIVNK